MSISLRKSWLPQAAQVVPSGSSAETSCAYQASAPSLWNRSTMLLLTLGSFSGVWHFSHMKTAMGTPQMRWREMVQSGRVAIMFEMRSCPQDGSHLTLAISLRVRWRKVVVAAACSGGASDELLGFVAQLRM